MNITQLGISREDLPIPGAAINEIRKDRGITQKELATRVGVTEPYLNKVIKGQKAISRKMAQGLEYALGIDKSVWLNLQSEYEASLLKLNEADSIDEEERSILRDLKKADVGKYLVRKGRIPRDDELVDTAVLSYRRGLGISSLRNLPNIVPAGAFRVGRSRRDPCIMGAWLLLATQATTMKADTEFSLNAMPDLVYELKQILNSSEHNNSMKIKKILMKYGISFATIPHFRGAPVHGYIAKNKDGHYRMVLTIRGAWADRLWFTLFHELGHMAHGDLNATGKLLDESENSESEIEQSANEFARRALIDDGAYACFVKAACFQDTDIESFAKTQNVPMWIVKGRLQNDKLVDQSNRSGMIRYAWAGNDSDT